jgi:tRNA(Ile)-lysidine synthase
MVSGGQDSLTLLELLANGLVGENGPDAVVALHVNHHLRGKDSMDDQALVERHCSRLGVELVVVDGRVAKAAGNVQEEARNIRRQAALELAARIGCTRIALGHTLDDQVETMLYRMGRYGGLAALRGMLPNDPPWVRPLLGLRRADTAAFCRARGLEFAVDRGNLYPGYARTGLRERVLPAWEAALPGAAEAAARTAEVAAEVEQVVASVLRDLPFSVDADELDVVRVRALPIALRRLVLHSWLAGHVSGSSTRTNVLAVDRLLFGGGSGAVDIGQGCCIYKEYDLLRVGKGPLPTTAAAGAAEVVELCVPGRAVWNGVVVRAEMAD